MSRTKQTAKKSAGNNLYDWGKKTKPRRVNQGNWDSRRRTRNTKKKSIANLPSTSSPPTISMHSHSEAEVLTPPHVTMRPPVPEKASGPGKNNQNSTENIAAIPKKQRPAATSNILSNLDVPENLRRRQRQPALSNLQSNLKDPPVATDDDEQKPAAVAPRIVAQQTALPNSGEAKLPVAPKTAESTPPHNTRSHSRSIANKQQDVVLFADVMSSPSRSKETMDQLMTRLHESFSNHMDKLEDLAKEVLPDLVSLPSEAVDFLLSIFGGGNVEPARHAEVDLIHFLPLGTSFKFASLAEHRMSNKQHQLSLRYFSGTGSIPTTPTTTDAHVAKDVADFFSGNFDNPENKPVKQCVECASSLFITVKSIPTPPRKSSKETAAVGGVVKIPDTASSGEDT